MDDAKKNQKQKKEEMVAKLQEEVEQYKTKYLRALADYQNFERRVREEKIELRTMANENFIRNLLPFLDSLEKAEIFIKDQGLQIIRNSFFQLLTNEGLKEIELAGKPFDPYTAEAVELIEGEKDNEVVEVLLKAYEYNGKMLRVGQVKVSKKK